MATEAYKLITALTLTLMVLVQFFALQRTTRDSIAQNEYPALLVKDQVEEKKPIWKTRATHCNTNDLVYEHRSQWDEDKRLLKDWFHGLCGGSYVELGGLDGVTYSNSFVFEKTLHWSGVLIELSPKLFQKLQRNRPRDKTLNAAVCDTPKTLHWIESKIPATSAIWEFATPSFRKQWWAGKTIDQAQPIECRPLGDFLDQPFYDFLSLDIEGAELMALQSLDFTKVAFGVILVEADTHNPRKNTAMRTLLTRNGYQYVDQLGSNAWYIHEQFDQMYADVVHSE